MEPTTFIPESEDGKTGRRAFNERWLACLRALDGIPTEALAPGCILELQEAANKLMVEVYELVRLINATGLERACIALEQVLLRFPDSELVTKQRVRFRSLYPKGDEDCGPVF